MKKRRGREMNATKPARHSSLRLRANGEICRSRGLSRQTLPSRDRSGRRINEERMKIIIVQPDYTNPSLNHAAPESELSGSQISDTREG
jgi:hypothetical protein